MSYDDDDIDSGFRLSADEDELDIPEAINDFGLDEEDPDRDG